MQCRNANVKCKLKYKFDIEMWIASWSAILKCMVELQMKC